MTTDAAPIEPPARRAGKLLLDRGFGPFFLGNLVSNSGTWFQNIAAVLLIHQLTGSATYVGLVSAMQFGMTLLWSPWAGTWADRVDRRWLMLFGQALGLTSAVSLALLARGPLSPVAILSLVALAGCGHAISSPAMQASIPNLVRPSEVAQAVALQSLTFNLARAVGPAAGAFVYARHGPSVSFAVNAASYGLFILLLLGLRLRRHHALRTADRSVLAGLRFVRQRPALVAALAGVGALGFVMDPVNTLTPSLAGLLGRGDEVVGIMVTTFGIGAVAVVPFISRLRGDRAPGTSGARALMVLAASQALLGLSPNLGIALVALLVGGAGFLFGVADLTAVIHARVNEHLKGRVMAIWGMAFLGSRPAAAVFHGSLADATNPRVTTIVTATLGVAAAVAVRRRLAAADRAVPR
ncbi:MFS transporter [Egicoccus sp. AB-alg2]|uniref:MFS transporter n=1 Tax=Egicoccus sp. AB-alg2 TaxID=3242693 RepID=UPI00359D2BB9